MAHRTIDLEKIGANFTAVSTTKGRIFFSYSTPVAAVVFNGGRKVRTTAWYSATSAKHLGIHCKDFEKVTPEEFDELLGEIA